MTGRHNPEKYKNLKETVENVVKKILNYETRPLPDDEKIREERINEYKNELIGSYNDLVEYVDEVYAGVDEKSKGILKDVVAGKKLRILRALLVFGLTTDLPERFDRIDINNIVDKDALGGGEDNSQIFVSTSQRPQVVQTSRRNSAESVLELGEIESNKDENTHEMALPLSDILNGIPDFSCKNHDEVKQFIAKAELIHSLATTQNDTVLSVIRTKLVTANKLGDISTSTWPNIKKMINEKYRISMSFETAQERLLSIKQGQKESLDDYANRTKILLDALNSASSNEDANVQAANRSNNESLAIRKFKQNVFDEKIRMLALSTNHSSLSDAIAHATEKKEQLQSSNIQREMQKNENKNEQNGRNSSNGNNGNKNNGGKKREKCVHCKKTNHVSDRCFFKPKDESSSSGKSDNKPEKFANRAKSNKNVSVASAEEENIESASNGLPLNQASAQNQTIQLQPYRYLNC